MGVANTEDAGRPAWRGGSSVVVQPGWGHRRNFVGACLCDVAVAIGASSHGTASEALFCLYLGRPLIILSDASKDDVATPACASRAEADPRARTSRSSLSTAESSTPTGGPPPPMPRRGSGRPAESCLRRRPRGQPAHGTSSNLPHASTSTPPSTSPGGMRTSRSASPSRAALLPVAALLSPRFCPWPAFCCPRFYFTLAVTRTFRPVKESSPQVDLCRRTRHRPHRRGKNPYRRSGCLPDPSRTVSTVPP